MAVLLSCLPAQLWAGDAWKGLRDWFPPTVEFGLGATFPQARPRHLAQRPVPPLNGAMVSWGWAQTVAVADLNMPRRGPWLASTDIAPGGEIWIDPRMTGNVGTFMSASIMLDSGGGEAGIRHEAISPIGSGNDSQTLAWSPTETGGAFLLALVSGAQGQSAAVGGLVTGQGVLLAAQGDLDLLHAGRTLSVQQSAQWQALAWDASNQLGQRGGFALRLGLASRRLNLQQVQSVHFGVAPASVELSHAQATQMTAQDLVVGVGARVPLSDRTRLRAALDIGARAMQTRIVTRDILEIGSFAQVEGPRGGGRLRSIAPTARLGLVLEHDLSAAARIHVGFAASMVPGVPQLVRHRAGDGLAVSLNGPELGVVGQDRAVWCSRIESHTVRDATLFVGLSVQF